MIALHKFTRLRRIMNVNNERVFVVPMDHGITVGPLVGIIDMPATVSDLKNTPVNSIVVHKGLVPTIASCWRKAGDLGLIVHLFGSTSAAPDPNAKASVCTVAEAVALGADAVSVHVNIGASTESQMIREMADVSQRCNELSIPLLAMMYARGAKIKSPFNVNFIAHCTRIAYEMGADIVKVAYTGDPETFTQVTQSVKIPVIIAGGPKMDSYKDILIMVQESISAGGSGVAFGRNVFQDPNVKNLASAIGAIIHENSSVEEALKLVTPSN